MGEHRVGGPLDKGAVLGLEAALGIGGLDGVGGRARGEPGASQEARLVSRQHHAVVGAGGQRGRQLVGGLQAGDERHAAAQLAQERGLGFGHHQHVAPLAEGSGRFFAGGALDLQSGLREEGLHPFDRADNQGLHISRP